MGLMKGKRGLIVGVANEKSIAWAIAQALHREGAELAFTYLNGSLEKRVRPLAESIGSSVILPCDVGRDEDIDALFDSLKKEWGSLDFLVHSVAFANKDELRGAFYDTSREGFSLAVDISAYSLVALTRGALPLMEGRNGSVLTLTYYGSEKVMPNYNVMGVAKSALETSVRYLAADLGPLGHRVNAISAGPVRTLAAAGIGDFRKIQLVNELRSPFGRLVTLEEIGNTALYLASDASTGMTGEILHLDCGFHAMSLSIKEATHMASRE
ncbi:MAG: enoyl-ACP reductase [Deltaproteobacteria bacterium]|nr:enoyl-ACP reductase [Deltaproteobacteria bacterium]